MSSMTCCVVSSATTLLLLDIFHLFQEQLRRTDFLQHPLLSLWLYIGFAVVWSIGQHITKKIADYTTSSFGCACRISDYGQPCRVARFRLSKSCRKRNNSLHMVRTKMKNSNNIRKIREERLMSKMELGRLAGVSSATIVRIERGEVCRLETKRKIILALGYALAEKSRVFPE